MLCKIHLSEQTLGFTGYETDEELILLKNLGFKSNWYKKKILIFNKIPR